MAGYAALDHCRRPFHTLPRNGLAEPKKLTAAEVYCQAVWSLVLIETNKGSGSGVCVGPCDLILTNDHVAGEGGDVFVSTFIQKDKELVRMTNCATVIFRSPGDDVAVLHSTRGNRQGAESSFIDA